MFNLWREREVFGKPRRRLTAYPTEHLLLILGLAGGRWLRRMVQSKSKCHLLFQRRQ